MSNSVGAVIVAAGRGTRMGTAESKQYLLLQGKPIIVHTLEVFQQHELISGIVLVAGQEDIERCREWVEAYKLDKVKAVVPGGSGTSALRTFGAKAAGHQLGHGA